MAGDQWLGHKQRLQIEQKTCRIERGLCSSLRTIVIVRATKHMANTYTKNAAFALPQHVPKTGNMP
jgi:hypothetical protein